MLFLPLIGFLVLLLVPKDNPDASRMGALVISLVIFVVVAGTARAVLVRGSHGLHVSNQRFLDQLPAHPLSRRARTA